MSASGVVSPYYANATPWPYLRGPNYTRPIFGEETRRGAFRLHPIVRMPALNGLGCMQKPGSALDILGRLQGVTYKGCGGLGGLTVPSTCWDAPGFKACHDKALADAQVVAGQAFQPGTAKYDGIVNNMRDAYLAERCMGLCPASAIDPAKSIPDPSKTNLPPGSIDPGAASATSWYRNPLYLGGAIIGGAIVLGVITKYLREHQ